MLNDRTLKQLAELTIIDGKVDESVQRYVLGKLSRAELKRYVTYLRNVLRDRQVLVRAPVPPDAATRTTVAGLFPGKDLRFVEEPSLGAGLQIEYGDNVINASIKSMIEKTIRQLKERT